MAARNWVRNAVRNPLLGSPLIPSEVRWVLCRAVGMQVRRSHIESQCWFGGSCISIGSRSFLGIRSFIDASARVDIGRDCAVGPNVSFLTSTHDVGSEERRAGSARATAIVIEDGVWIGGSAVILGGVTIGKGCVVGAGSLVVSDCAPNGLYGGVPARRIRDLD